MNCLATGSAYLSSEPESLSTYFLAYEAIEIAFYGLISVILYNFSNNTLTT